MAILKVRDLNNKWEAVKDIDFDTVSIKGIEIKNEDNKLSADGKKIAYESDIADIVKEIEKLKNKINTEPQSSESTTIELDKDISEYSIKKASSITIKGYGYKTHGFVSFTSKPSINYENNNHKDSGVDFS